MYIYAREIRANTSRETERKRERAVHRRDIGRRERGSGTRRALSRADDGRMTGKCEDDDRVPSAGSEDRVAGKIRRLYIYIYRRDFINSKKISSND